MVAVNTLGTARMSRKAVRQFIEQDYDANWGRLGRFVNVSSCIGVFGFPGEVAYLLCDKGVHQPYNESRSPVLYKRRHQL